MNLLSLLVREEPIAGLEVSDSHVRLALFAEGQGSKPGLTLKAAVEVSLPPGTVVDGSLRSPQAYTKALRKLLTTAGQDIRYAVLSLPTDRVYTKVYSFPRAVATEKLEQTMKLNVGFLLPVRPEDVYLDWEKLGGKDKEVFLATVAKSTVDPYLQASAAAGLNITAVEFHALSLARIVNESSQEHLVFVVPGRSSTGLYVIQGTVVSFSRIIPHEHVPPDRISEEVRKLKDFYEAKHAPITRVINLSEAKVLGPLATYTWTKDRPREWLVCSGAALRGLLPRSKDKLVSLMAVGTEEAYELQKASLFTEFLSTITIGLSIFFIMVFVGVWIFMVSLQKNFNKQFAVLSSVTVPTEMIELESRADRFNALVKSAQSIVASSPRWTLVLGELRQRIVPGITVNSLTVSTMQDPIALVGVASTRIQLNALKKSLEESSQVGEVVIPLTNLELKENIPFTLTLRIKDASLVSSL